MAVTTYETLADFCRRTTISRSTVYRLISANKLPTRKVGRRRLVPVGAELAINDGTAA